MIEITEVFYLVDKDRQDCRITSAPHVLAELLSSGFEIVPFEIYWKVKQRQEKNVEEN